jgi:hypothetical protein
MNLTIQMGLAACTYRIEDLELANRSIKSVLSRVVMIKISCAVLPRRAINLNPPRIGTDGLSVRSSQRPFTLAITPGVMVWICGSFAKTLSQGISPFT